MKRWGAEFIEVQGARVETLCLGSAPDTAPTLILLHEGLGSVSLWGDFPHALQKATGCGVFAYSRLGYGHSDPCPLPRPLDYMEREAKEFLPDVLDAIGFKRGALVGHSDGASIALLYMGSHQDHRIRAAVLMAPHVIVEDVSIAAITVAKQLYETSDLKQRLARHHTHVETAFRGWNDAWLAPGFRTWDIRWAAAYARVPLLVVQGRDDQYGTSRQFEIIAQEAYCPVVTVHLSDCGHSPHREQRAATLEAILAHLSSLEDDLWADWRPQTDFFARRELPSVALADQT